MKKLLIPFTLLVLVACGGGGGVNPPTPSPKPTITASSTPTPTSTPITYSVQLRVYGSMNQGSTALQIAARPFASSSQVPIMLVAPLVDNPGPGETVGNGTSAIVQAQVSPAPSATPTVAFTTTSTVAQIQATPSPEPGRTPGIPDAVYVAADKAGKTECNANVSAQVSAPVNTNTSRPLCIYPQYLLQNGTQPISPEASNGLSISNGVISASTTGDMYLDGKGNLVFPSGATAFTSDTAFNGLACSQWTNTATSYSLMSMGTVTGDGAIQYGEFIFHTADGECAKAFVLEMQPGNGSNEELDTTVQVGGHAIDGFN